MDCAGFKSCLLPPLLQEQGILHAEAVEGGGAKLYITLLAAGFIIGAPHSAWCHAPAHKAFQLGRTRQAV
jgi:hypothetical protein